MHGIHSIAVALPHLSRREYYFKTPGGYLRYNNRIVVSVRSVACSYPVGNTPSRPPPGCGGLSTPWFSPPFPAAAVVVVVVPTAVFVDLVASSVPEPPTT